MTEFFIRHLVDFVELAKVWGFVLIFIFMTIESSFIPFPSEVVMIPAGFMAARGELVFTSGPGAAATAVIVGVFGSLAGAYVNYYLALYLGRPVLYRYAKWLFLSPQQLERAEAIFREYGDGTTFVCRLLPAIRQVISLPAGLARMAFWRFTFFTVLGAGIWVIILTAVGYYLGTVMRTEAGKPVDYPDLVHQGLALLHRYTLWIILAAVAMFIAYVWLHRRIMRGKGPAAPPPAA